MSVIHTGRLGLGTASLSGAFQGCAIRLDGTKFGEIGCRGLPKEFLGQLQAMKGNRHDVVSDRVLLDPLQGFHIGAKYKADACPFESSSAKPKGLECCQLVCVKSESRLSRNCVGGFSYSIEPKAAVNAVGFRVGGESGCREGLYQLVEGAGRGIGFVASSGLYFYGSDVDPTFKGVQRDCEQVCPFGWEPMPVLIEANQKDPAPCREGPGRGGGCKEAERNHVSDEFVDPRATGGSLQGKDSVALTRDFPKIGSYRQRDVRVFDDSGSPETPTYRSVDGAAGLLAENQGERAVASQSPLLVENRDVAGSERLLKAVASCITV